MGEGRVGEEREEMEEGKGEERGVGVRSTSINQLQLCLFIVLYKTFCGRKF